MEPLEEKRDVVHLLFATEQIFQGKPTQVSVLLDAFWHSPFLHPLCSFPLYAADCDRDLIEVASWTRRIL